MVQTVCVDCGEPVYSVVRDAYCWDCDPTRLRTLLAYEAQMDSARLNAKPAAAEGEGRDDGNATAEEG